MDFDLFEYLEEKELQPKWATPEEIRCLCPFHEEEPHKPGRLYINSENPNHPFKCFVCEEVGILNKLRAHFGDENLASSKVEDVVDLQLCYDIYNEAVEYCHDRLLEDDDKMSYLIEQRGLEAETIVHFKLGYNDGTLCEHLLSTWSESDLIKAGLLSKNKYDIFSGGVIIPYIKFGQVVQLRARMFEGNAKYKGIGKMPIALFNLDTILEHPDGQAVIVEGEFDAMIMHQMGFTCIGLPGAQNWKQEWAQYFNEHQVFLWLDQDTAGREGVKKIDNIRGVRIVEMDKYRDKDISDLHMMGRDADWFQSILNSVKAKWVRSVQDAFDEWQEYDGNENLDGVRLGYDIFDINVESGFLPADLIVLLAATNAGKTIFLLNVAQNIRMLQPEKHMLMISLEQTAGQWFERARRINRFYTMEPDPHKNHLETVELWKDKFMIVDVNRLGPEGMYEAIDEYKMIMGVRPDIVFVDYLGYYARGFLGESYGRTSDAVMHLKEVAKSTKTMIFAPHQVNRGAKQGEVVSIDEARDSGVVGETADFLFAMWNPEAIKGNHNKEKSYIREFKIDKSRRGPTGIGAKLQFARNSLVLVENTSAKLYNRAVTENNLARKADNRTYEACVQALIEDEIKKTELEEVGREDIPEF
jgi:hypothetical protein